MNASLGHKHKGTHISLTNINIIILLPIDWYTHLQLQIPTLPEFWHKIYINGYGKDAGIFYHKKWWMSNPALTFEKVRKGKCVER